MPILTSSREGNSWRLAWLALGFAFCAATSLVAQPETNSGVPGPGEISAASAMATTNAPATNAPTVSAVVPDATPSTVPDPNVRTIPEGNPMDYASYGSFKIPAGTLVPSSIPCALLALASLGGFSALSMRADAREE